ncbi:GatB/YqeY domain-containing protein [Dongia sp.]|uniref:GatB/YqeY domain-containing protein n=1 Tax=Dongia sp. TaxID=1977262 RepID=UPI0035B1E195
MLRQRINDDVKTAMKAKDEALSGLRLITAAIKDKDIAARPGNMNGISDAEIIDMLQKMVRQRQESIEMYTKGNRPELAAKEQAEIEVIQRYLPKQMGEAETEAAIAAIVTETGASSIKDMGKVMSVLKERYAGQLDFAKIGPMVKAKLG